MPEFDPIPPDPAPPADRPRGEIERAKPARTLRKGTPTPGNAARAGALWYPGVPANFGILKFLANEAE